MPRKPENKMYKLYQLYIQVYIWYIHGIYMVYTWYILMYDESTWWLQTFTCCKPISTTYTWYIHGIYMVYTWYIPSIWCPHPYVWYIPCKTFIGLFRTFFYIDIRVIYQVYPQDIHGISQVYQYKKRYGTNL